MTKPLQERIGGGVGGGGGGKRWWGLCGIQWDGKERIGTKVKTWGEGWGLFLILFRTVEPRYNESPRYNKRYFLPQLQYHVWKRTSI